MRKVLDSAKLADSAVKAISEFYPSSVQEVEEAIKANDYVVVGMKQNPVVKKARRLLDEKGIAFKYIENGGYFSMWKPRLAIKLWSGWPTYPMVFVKGKLIGGCSELVDFLEAQAK
jgi:monothiol glutaredoxin